MNGKQGESAYDLGVNMEDWTYQQICSGRMLEHLQEGIHDKLAMVPLLTLCGRNVIGILLASLKV